MPKRKPAIVTLGSHSALQIAKGASQEGLDSIIITTPKNAGMYRRFPFITKVIEIPSFADFPSVEKELLGDHNVVIPHGSFVAYLGLEKNKDMKLPYFGNKHVLDFEFDRKKQLEWMDDAQIQSPKQFTDSASVDRTVIVKTYGANGGVGYFLARNPDDFNSQVKQLGDQKYVVQQYVIGVPMYIHYFYSPLTDTLEIMSIDRRYETNVDGIGRLPLQHQDGLIEPTYTVVGNSPLSVRESLMPKLYEMGEQVVASSRKLISPQGLFGPFCLETIIDEHQEFWVIEISARIVAGTNLFMNGSQYSDLLYDEPMSTGRRIAREVKTAWQQGNLETVLHHD